MKYINSFFILFFLFMSRAYSGWECTDPFSDGNIFDPFQLFFHPEGEKKKDILNSPSPANHTFETGVVSGGESDIAVELVISRGPELSVAHENFNENIHLVHNLSNSIDSESHQESMSGGVAAGRRDAEIHSPIISHSSVIKEGGVSAASQFDVKNEFVNNKDEISMTDSNKSEDLVSRFWNKLKSVDPVYGSAATFLLGAAASFGLLKYRHKKELEEISVAISKLENEKNELEDNKNNCYEKR
jgi:hypothetical protein